MHSNRSENCIKNQNTHKTQYSWQHSVEGVHNLPHALQWSQNIDSKWEQTTHK